jgi:16S rRNA (guanine527-N7)-methyltransferase
VDRELREILVTGSSALGVSLTEEAVERFAAYLSLIQTWGRKINLTARIEGREIVIHHFLDSLAGFGRLSPTPDARVVDLGAGAGLPSIALKFALPRLTITLVESVRKKVSFCQEVIRATGVQGIAAVWGRGEELGLRPEHHAGYSWAVSRALGQAAGVVRLSLPFLEPGGRVLLYKGDPGRDELRELDGLCSEIGAAWEIRPISVPRLEEARALILVTTAR